MLLNSPLCLLTINVTIHVHGCHVQKSFHGGDTPFAGGGQGVLWVPTMVILCVPSDTCVPLKVGSV